MTKENDLMNALAEATAAPHADALTHIGQGPMFIYGAGNYGRIIYRLLTANGIGPDSIPGFLDRAAGAQATLFGLPVRKPDDTGIGAADRCAATVIISIYTSLDEHDEIAQSLRHLGYCSTISCYDIALCFHTQNDPTARIAGTGFFAANRDAILRGADVWADQISRDTYCNHIMGYACGDIRRFSLETGHKQYCAPLPIGAKGHARIIDCGAFTGDSVRDWVETFGKTETLALFEPCRDNFSALADYIRSKKESVTNLALLFPCGVWDTTAMLRFNGNAASASAVSEQGDDSIQCVSIDDALQGFAPTLIKMDIEGAEPQALKGAQETIRCHAPDLAISVYHALRHLWELPAFVSQLVPEYNLYLRTYGAAGTETVMYATTETRARV